MRKPACLPVAEQGLGSGLPHLSAPQPSQERETEGGRWGLRAWPGPDLIWPDSALHLPVQQGGWTSEGRGGQAGSPCSSGNLLDPQLPAALLGLTLPAWRRPTLGPKACYPTGFWNTALESRQELEVGRPPGNPLFGKRGTGLQILLSLRLLDSLGHRRTWLQWPQAKLTCWNLGQSPARAM